MPKRIGRTIAYSPSLGRIIARAARRSRNGRFHVIPSISEEGKWSLVSEGSTKPIRTFMTKNAAVRFAKKSDAGKKGGHVIIHGRDGRMHEEVSFQPQD